MMVRAAAARPPGEFRRPSDDAAGQGSQVLGRLPRLPGEARGEGAGGIVPVSCKGRPATFRPIRRESERRRSSAPTSGPSSWTGAGSSNAIAPTSKGSWSRSATFGFAARVDISNPFVFAAYSYAFFPGLIEFYKQEYRDGVRPHLTVASLDGRIGLVGVSGEFFCSHAIQLKRRARFEHLLFLGYCNDYQQYFPTIEAAAEGGYGADATVAQAEIGAGERDHGSGADGFAGKVLLTLRVRKGAALNKSRGFGGNVQKHWQWRAFIALPPPLTPHTPLQRTRGGFLLPVDT